MSDGPLTITLSPDEVDLLHDCIAGEAARVLMYGSVEQLEPLTELGIKLGMEL